MRAVSLTGSTASSSASNTSESSPVKASENLWGDYDVSTNDQGNEEEENLWAGGQPKRATDWDKLICPVHQIKCSGTCEVVSKIKAEKKREMAMKEGGNKRDGDGWREAKTRGRGRECSFAFLTLAWCG